MCAFSLCPAYLCQCPSLSPNPDYLLFHFFVKLFFFFKETNTKCLLRIWRHWCCCLDLAFGSTQWMVLVHKQSATLSFLERKGLIFALKYLVRAAFFVLFLPSGHSLKGNLFISSQFILCSALKSFIHAMTCLLSLTLFQFYFRYTIDLGSLSVVMLEMGNKSGCPWVASFSSRGSYGFICPVFCSVGWSLSPLLMPLSANNSLSFTCQAEGKFKCTVVCG